MQINTKIKIYTYEMFVTMFTDERLSTVAIILICITK